MKRAKIIAWTALAGGADHAAGKYRMSFGGGTKSAVETKKAVEEHFAKSWPGVVMNVIEVQPIREGD